MPVIHYNVPPIQRAWHVVTEQLRMYQEIVKENVCEAHKRAIKNNAKAPLNVGTLFDLDELFQ